MSNASKTAPAAHGEHAVVPESHSPRTAETESSFTTTELVVFLVMALGIIITASVIVNAGGGADHFDALQATQLLTLLTVGSMIARGIAESGSRLPATDLPAKASLPVIDRRGRLRPFPAVRGTPLAAG